eukprot:gene28908-32103_t
MKSKRSSIFLFVSLLLVGCTTFVTVYLLAQDPTSSLWGAGRKWTTAASANTSSAPSYAAGTSSSSVLDPSSHKFAGAAASALKDPLAGKPRQSGWPESLAQKQRLATGTSGASKAWSRSCPNGTVAVPRLHNMGNCNHATGNVECQAGFIGDDCTRGSKRTVYGGRERRTSKPLRPQAMNPVL